MTPAFADALKHSRLSRFQVAAGDGALEPGVAGFYRYARFGLAGYRAGERLRGWARIDETVTDREAEVLLDLSTPGDRK